MGVTLNLIENVSSSILDTATTQRCNRSGTTGPDRLNWLDRPVFAGFGQSEEISKLPCGPPQGQLKNKFYNFVDIQFFHNKIRREKV